MSGGLSNLDRRGVGRVTRVAQAGAVALAALGLAAFALVPTDARLDAPGDLMPEPPAPDAGPATREPVPVATDTLGIAARLARIANAPVPPAPVAEVPSGEEVPTEPTPPTGPVVRYLGVARVGADLVALIADGARQRFVRIGASTTDGTVTRITPTAIDLERDGRVTTIELAERSGPALTLARATPIQRPVPQATDQRQAGRGIPPQPTRPGQPVPSSLQSQRGGGMDPTPVDWEAARAQMRASGNYATEEEINQAAGKLLEEEVRQRLEQAGKQQRPPQQEGKP